ncbi:hypothetical protein NQ317_011394, partial [Molorchus minor]
IVPTPTFFFYFQFYSLLEHSKLANFTLGFKQVTIFAPINTAFQKMGDIKEDTNDLVLYHMSSIPRKTNELGTSYTSLSSELSGNPPLWIAHVRGQYHDDIYVNNARVLLQSVQYNGHQYGTNSGKDHMNLVLHKIDEVLVPTISHKLASNRIYNPTAWEFLEKYESLMQVQDTHRVRNFRQKIEENNKQDIFNTEGGHTFFIPVDEGFGNGRAALVDAKTIDGHVIPKQVLFTTPTKKDIPYQTLANDQNNIRVIIFFTQEQRGSTVINYVKSHTLFGDGKHTPGVVLAEIVKPNIPVKNGVIHLIHKPLMVVDSTVRELLQEHMDYICSIGNTARGENFKEPEYLDYADNPDYARNNQNPVPTLARGKYLYFNVVQAGDNKTLTVEGGGVNATVIQPDLAATNGVIHIIDRVFGVPYTTVYDKLATDAVVRDSFMLGNLQGFNEQLKDTTKKFTYFVPSNRAWADAKVALPSAIRKLFMREYAYHATATLENHLVISDAAFTMERIKQLTNETNAFGIRRNIELPTARGSLKLYVEDRGDSNNLGQPVVDLYNCICILLDFIIHWKGEKIPVFRPNVECTNGIIHIIDAPFLKEGDIQVSSASVLYIAPQILMIMIAKFLLLE